MKKVFLLFIVSLCFGIIGLVLWPGSAYAPPPGCSPVAQNLAACQGDLDVCEDDLAACEAECLEPDPCTQTFPGDGAGSGPALSYTNNNDGTVTDNNTKFMWEIKLAANDVGGNCADATQANRSVHCVNNTYTWTDGGDGDFTDPDGTLFTVFLAGLNNSAFAGFSDWGIPNVKELQSIVDYGTVSPAIDSTFPGATASSFYWSANTDGGVGSSGNAWTVYFGNGFVNGNDKNNRFHARAVRPCP